MKSISIRFPDDIKEKLDEASKEDGGRSVNSYVVQAVKEKIKADKKAK